MFNFKGSTPTKKQLLLEIKDFTEKRIKTQNLENAIKFEIRR